MFRINNLNNRASTKQSLDPFGPSQGRKYTRGVCFMGAARILLQWFQVYFSVTKPLSRRDDCGHYLSFWRPMSNSGAIGWMSMFLIREAWLRPWYVVAYHARVRNTDGSRLGGGRRGGGGGRSRQRQRSEPRGMPRALSTDTLQHSDTHSYRDRPRSRS